MLEYWMANNETSSNGSELRIEEVLEDPGSAVLFEGYPPWLMYFAAGCCLLFMLIGIPGNLITVAALFRTKKLRNATAVFIMNLSISDLMFCCFNLPLATSTFWHGSWTHGALLCRLFPLLRYGLVAVSLFTVLAITINRYVMIGHPRLYPKLYKAKYLVGMVLATWISGFGALVATWFERWGRFGLDPAIGSCSILPDVNGRSPKEFLFILAFLTPCIAIIVCYARIFYIVRRTAMKSRRRDKVTTDLVKASLEVKYTKNLEDSAIGSSCGATLTTTENGCASPTKIDHRDTTFPSLTPPKVIDTNSQDNSETIVQNQNFFEIVDKSANNEIIKEYSSENNANCTKFERNENTVTDSIVNGVDNWLNDRSKIPDLRIQDDGCKDNSRGESSEDEEDPPSNFERSVEFLPFIDIYADESNDDEADSILTNSENVAMPNLGLYENDSTSEQSEKEKQEKKEHKERHCLRVPQRFPRCSKKSDIDELSEQNVAEDAKHRRMILDTKNLEKKENGLEMSKCAYLGDFYYNENRLLSPKSRRYTNEISDEYASSRSDSISERRSSTKKPNILRRESRFRSVRNRNFESGKMTAKDKKLLKMILVIFSSFLICYLPITITKIFKDVIDWRGLNIAGYILIYLTTCINPVIYVVMSSEYRCAYKNVLLCRSDSTASNCKQLAAKTRQRTTPK